MQRTRHYLAPLVLALTLVIGCTDRVLSPIPPPEHSSHMLMDGDTTSTVTGGSSVPAGMEAYTFAIPTEAYGDPLFYTAQTDQADGPCDATRNAQFWAWVDLVTVTYASGAAVISASALTAATAGTAAPVTIFVTFGSALAVSRVLNTFYGAAKENQLCRLRNRLYPYNQP